jgi:hypothetical protein
LSGEKCDSFSWANQKVRGAKCLGLTVDGGCQVNDLTQLSCL